MDQPEILVILSGGGPRGDGASSGWRLVAVWGRVLREILSGAARGTRLSFTIKS